MGRLRITLCAAAVAVCSSVTSAQTPAAPIQLAPNGGWTADFAEDSCALRRAFADGRHSVLFELRQLAPGSGVEIAVVSSTLDRRGKPPQTRFLPDGNLRDHTAFRTFTTDDRREGIIVSDSLLGPSGREAAKKVAGSFSWPTADRERRVAEISGYFVGNAFDEDFTLMTGSLSQPMKVMQTCLDDLLTRWGLDPVAQRSLTRQVTADFDKPWFTNLMRFQSSLMGWSNSALLQARLIVDASGRVTECKVLDGNTNEKKADDFCAEVIKKAEFEPALDANGQPIKSFFLLQITMAKRTQIQRI